jgi:hypothetical protein
MKTHVALLMVLTGDHSKVMRRTTKRIAVAATKCWQLLMV